jgi:hypothetical protein
MKAKKTTTTRTKANGAAKRAARAVPARRSPPPRPIVSTELADQPKSAVQRPAVPSPTLPVAEPEEVLISKAGLKIPAILLEGDFPPVPPPVSRPGMPSEPSPALPPAAPAAGAAPLLPEAYGTAELFLAARDPHWLHVYWDLAGDEQRRCNALSAEGHPVLRIFRNSLSGQPVHELRLEPESRDWFVQVGRPGTRFIAELGYHGHEGTWVRLAVSQTSTTPSGIISEDATGHFATFPLDVPLATLPPVVVPADEQKESGDRRQEAGGRTQETGAAPAGEAQLPQPAAVLSFPLPDQPLPQTPWESPREMAFTENAPGAPTFLPTCETPIQPLADAATLVTPAIPRPAQADAPMPSITGEAVTRTWEAAREQAIYELIQTQMERRGSASSAEIAELVRRAVRKVMAAGAVREIGQPDLREGEVALHHPELVPPPAGISSAGAPPPAPARPFWFNVNAELVIYGATEPDAKVTLGGRPIQLRPDGTFSFRFALPDGIFSLPAEAASADGQDQRRAELGFSRATRYQGEVGTPPRDPSLKPPMQESV